MTKLKVGIVGAGPWAHSFHAPMFANAQQTELAGIWARRQDAASELASAYGSQAVESFDELLDVSEAIVFTVPPDVQAQYVPRAAQAGKALLLEKPLGLSLAEAERVADAVNSAGAANQVMFTNRYSSRVRTFIDDVRASEPIGALGHYINGACLPGGYFATPWRVAKGALLDLGPHMLDLLDASMGPIVDIRGQGDPTRWFTLTVEHESGALSQASLSLNTPTDGEVTGVRAFTDRGEFRVEFVGKDGDPTVPDVIRNEFVQTATSGRSHEMDVNRALYIQRWLEKAQQTAAQ